MYVLSVVGSRWTESINFTISRRHMYACEIICKLLVHASTVDIWCALCASVFAYVSLTMQTKCFFWPKPIDSGWTWTFGHIQIAISLCCCCSIRHRKSRIQPDCLFKSKRDWMLWPNIWEEHKNHLNKQQLIQINFWTLTATMMYTSSDDALCCRQRQWRQSA